MSIVGGNSSILFNGVPLTGYDEVIEDEVICTGIFKFSVKEVSMPNNIMDSVGVQDDYTIELFTANVLKRKHRQIRRNKKRANGTKRKKSLRGFVNTTRFLRGRALFQSASNNGDGIVDIVLRILKEKSK